MKTVDYIKFKINRLPKGFVFTYTDFTNEEYTKEAIIKSLNRMAASDKIKKLAKGKFYKPEKSVFGTLLPDINQVVKDLLEKDGKMIGYITGLGIYNQLQLTSQITNTIQIGRSEIRSPITRGNYKISFIKQKNTITKENIPLLQLLDAIRYIKKIPDTTTSKAVKRMQNIISLLKAADKNTLAKLSRKYPPATRAVLGAILELENNKNARWLKDTLNGITKYNLGISAEVLPNKQNWNIQ